jgi:hypothetical protein
MNDDNIALTDTQKELRHAMKVAYIVRATQLAQKAETKSGAQKAETLYAIIEALLRDLESGYLKHLS